MTALDAKRRRFLEAREPRAVVDDLARVQTSVLESHGTAILCVDGSASGVDARAWLAENRASVDAALREHGGVLLRGFAVDTLDAFERIARVFCPDLMDYAYGSTPRTRVEGKVYTSTEYPPDQHIPLHGELSYARAWPMKIFFHCVLPAESGGETPLASSALVYDRIPPAVRERFERHGVMYVRNFGPTRGLDLSWRAAFQTDDRAEVEAQCARMGVAFEWREHDRLQTRQVCQASARHPVTGRVVWFNQAHLFHVSSLEPRTREALLAMVPEDALPRNARYGDGAPIEPDALDAVRRAYRESALAFAWRRGDLVVLDNMAMAHGRAPFTGPRRVVVAMGDEWSGDADRAAQPL